MVRHSGLNREESGLWARFGTAISTHGRYAGVTTLWPPQEFSPATRRTTPARLSHDAELVAFRVGHHEMIQVVTDAILAEQDRPGADQLGRLGADPWFA